MGALSLLVLLALLGILVLGVGLSGRLEVIDVSDPMLGLRRPCRKNFVLPFLALASSLHLCKTVMPSPSLEQRLCVVWLRESLGSHTPLGLC